MKRAVGLASIARTTLDRKRLVLVIGASVAGMIETGFITSSIVFLLGLFGLLIIARQQPEEAGLTASLTAAAVGVVTGIAYIVLEALLFWPGLPPALRALTPAPLAPRLAYFIVAACQDEVIWRLFGLSLLLVLLMRLRGEDRPSASTVAAAIVLSAALYVTFHLPFVTSRAPLTPFLVARELALHFTTPIVWGIVYCRRGLAASMTAHAAAHLPIQFGMTLLAS
jgi:Type II CAAX prenyl endopeptidase Rce1-like